MSGRDQEGERKRIADEVSKISGDVKTKAALRPWDKPGRYPSTGWAASGMKATRAWSAASTRNVGEQTPKLSAWKGWREEARASGKNRKTLSTVAGYAVGPAHSSDEASVTGVERRSWTILGSLSGQPVSREGSDG